MFVEGKLMTDCHLPLIRFSIAFKIISHIRGVTIDGVWISE
jgi:hypothetical protein